MEIIPVQPPPKRNLGGNCMSRHIRNGPRGKELCAKSLLLPSEQPAVCPPRTCPKCRPKPKCVRSLYVQPPRPKNFAPIKTYCRPTEKLEDSTIYRQSYMPVESERPNIIIPPNNIGLSRAKFAKDTVQKMSYPGWYNQDRPTQILPCNHDLLGKGPLADETTNRHDYVPKYVDKAEPFHPQNNLGLSDCPFATKTVQKMSYMPVDCIERREPLKTKGSIEWPTGKMDGNTIQKMSYQPVKIPRKQFLPWAQKTPYCPPTIKMNGDTIYKKSYIPNEGLDKVCPIRPKENANLLGDGRDFDDNTIYHMSYQGTGSERPESIRPENNIFLSKQRMEGRTVQKMSYQPNPCHLPPTPFHPCNHDLLGKGPISDVTTNRHDYVPKDVDKVIPFVPQGQIFLSNQPLSDKTVNRMSYMPHDHQEMVQKIIPPNNLTQGKGRIDGTTIQKMSYQPVGPIEPMDMPWKEKKPYCPPIHRFADDTVYRMSFEAPGDWVGDCDGGGGDYDGPCECQCPPAECPCVCPCSPVPVC